MNNKDEIVRLILKFCYGAEDVFIHTYPNDEDLTMSKYVSFIINDKTKHMSILEIDYNFSDIFDIDLGMLQNKDGMFIWTPDEVVLFPCSKVKEVIQGYDGDVIPMSLVNGFLTRIKMSKI